MTYEPGQQRKNSWRLILGKFGLGLSLVTISICGLTGVLQSDAAPLTGTVNHAKRVPSATVPSMTTTVQKEAYSNWSGYAVTGGPYTRISATFTVPYLTLAAGCNEETWEWVGIDGARGSPGAEDLIQAGIGESMSDPATGVCTPGTFYIWPWWEVLPAPETPVSGWRGTAVRAGDQVTVTIQRIGGSNWSIRLTDNTSGGSFSTEQTYNGPASSGEWILEAPADSGLWGSGVDGHGTCVLAPYIDRSNGRHGVVFSNLKLAPTNGNEWQEIATVQSGVQVSTPSALSMNGSAVTGFTLSYTGLSASRRQAARPAVSRGPNASR